MNKNGLKSKMALYGDSIKSLAKHIGISDSTLSAKLNSYKGAEFTQGEIDSIKAKYNLSADEIVGIFFAD